MIRVCLSKNQIIRRSALVSLGKVITFAILLSMASSTSQAGIVPAYGYAETKIWSPADSKFVYGPDVSLPLPPPPGSPPLPIVSGQSVTSSIESDGAKSRSVTTVHVEEVGSRLIYDFTVDQSISGAEVSQAYTFFELLFDADTPFRYTVSGEYQVSGVGSPYFAVLGLGGPGTDIFGAYKESRSTPNQKFTLTGNDTGDYGNYFVGPASGTGIVDPGGIKTRYGTIAEIALNSYANQDPSWAIGSFRVIIEPASAPVPEPTSMIAMGMGFTGLAIALRRRRRPGTRSQLGA